MTEEPSCAVRKPRRIALKVVAILCGLLVAAEITVRVIAAFTTQPAEEPARKDDSGIRGLEEMIARVPDDPNRVRIAFVGDSYTKGVEGITPEQTFAHHVGVALEKWKPGRYVTLTLAMSGSDSIGEWMMYNRLRDAARADVVVHVISPRGLDIDACTELFAAQRFFAQRLWISKYLMLADLLEQEVRRDIAERRFIRYLKGGATEDQRERAWRVFLWETRAMKKLVEEGGGVYVMVRFPLVGFSGPYPLHDVHRRGAGLAADLRVAYLDLLDAFPNQDTSKMGCWEGDFHPSETAHKIAAEAITDFLKQSILPKISGPGTNRVKKPRTQSEILAAEGRHYQELTAIEPNCLSAKFWLGTFRSAGTSSGPAGVDPKGPHSDLR